MPKVNRNTKVNTLENYYGKGHKTSVKNIFETALDEQMKLIKKNENASQLGAVVDNSSEMHGVESITPDRNQFGEDNEESTSNGKVNSDLTEFIFINFHDIFIKFFR